MPEPVVSVSSGANHAANLTTSAKSLLDFEQKLDISLLDSVIDCMYQGELQQQKAAQEILTTLKVCISYSVFKSRSNIRPIFDI